MGHDQLVQHFTTRANEFSEEEMRREGGCDTRNFHRKRRKGLRLDVRENGGGDLNGAGLGLVNETNGCGEMANGAEEI